MIYEIKPTNIADIRAGDTVEYDGRVMTVCEKDIIRGGFMGTTLFGDSYRMGTVPVRKLIIRRASCLI